ncbi:MAG TPA: tetratricopeptide repeat protein [Acetobacteraceae bacterium]
MNRALATRLIVPLVLLASTIPAVAQVESREGIALQNQILELRRQMQALQDQANRGGGSPTNLGRAYPQPSTGGSDLVAQLLSRVDALEEQVRQLRGRVDETQNEVQRQGADLGKRIDDMAFQAQSPRGGPPSPTVSPQPPSSLGAAAAPSAPARRTPELVMQEGNAALARRDYPAAEQAAREVLTSNRTSPRAYDAQFLLAQALIGQHQYSQAAIAYDDTYNRSRKGAHAPDALLGLANSLIAINEKKAACDTLAKLHGEYPSPRPDVRDAMAASSQRAACR